LIEVIGKFGIKATVLAHSISPQGIPFITYEIEYPRLILAELNTHRMLSKNSFSSRAVPFNKMIEQLNGRPVRFGQANPGMQDRGEDYNAGVNYLFPCPITGVPQGGITVTALEAWEETRRAAIRHAKAFYEAGYHKQIYNRLLEPFQMMKTIISGTEWPNFFWLRDDKAADPTIAELARVMHEAKEQSAPELLQPGEYHLPYIDTVRDDNGTLLYGDKCETAWGATWEFFSLEDAIKVSCARCAAVSYRNEGYGLDKSLEVFERLVGSDKKHASAFEHCATPMQEKYIDDEVASKSINIPRFPESWEDGVTHMDSSYKLWSGNLRGWIQFRKLIPGECYEGA
jgi:thymidylate synthase ThyX